MIANRAGFQNTRVLPGVAGLVLAICLIIFAVSRQSSGGDPGGQTTGVQSTAVESPSSGAGDVGGGRTTGGPGISDVSAPPRAAPGPSDDREPHAPATVPPTSSAVPVANKNQPSRGESTRALAVPGKSVASILNGVDMSDPAARAKAEREMREFQAAQRAAVEEKARLLGIPLRIDGPGHKVSILHDFLGDQPLYRTNKNANAAISTGANLLAPAPYSLTGSGIRVGVWDGGSVRSTHQELNGRVTRKNTAAANDDHATHVAGTIGASGVQAGAKGMAPQINIDSYDWDSDYAEMTAAGAATAGDAALLPLSNHSYGYNAVTADMGRYETEAAAVDAVAASLPYYLPCWAAGNEQDVLTAKGGFQSVTFNALAKNVLTVGAVDDAVSGGVRNPALGTIAAFSSLGPCDDGRIKPDVVANGVNVYSCIATSNTAYDGTYDGTSMATPNALGSAALLVQLYGREFSGQRMPASMLKALLIHTADDRGNPGPDYTYGWGLVNVKAGADLILAHKSSLGSPKMIEGAVTSAAPTVNRTFTWDGSSPIRATLCWTDPAGTEQTNADSRTPNLKHNLDLKITAPNGSTVYQPFVMPFVGNWSTGSMGSAAITGKNNVDNVEQVYLAAPNQAGAYTVTVSLDGPLTTSSQAYSLVLTGGAGQAANPPPSVALTSPAGGSSFLSGAPVTVSATASDLTGGGSAGTVAQVEFFNGATSLGVDAGAPYSLNWTPPAAGSYTLTARATDSEGASATSSSATITVLSGNGAPVIASFSPTSGVAGATVVLTGSNYVGVTAVRFNGTDAVFAVNSAGQITATVPSTATTGAVTVVNGYGTGTSGTAFTVLQAPVLISQIYGGGGNTGATYNRDYVELYNRSGSAVDLTGWSVQYAAATGTTWQTAPLTGSIAAGRRYLVGLGTGASGSALPAVDASGSLAMGATAGKIALRNNSTAFSGSSPVGASGLQDFVGYGTANASEGSPAPAPSTTTAIFRAGGGATDTVNNAADFTASAPVPRNSAWVPPTPPVITASGAPAATNSTYGSASAAPASFTVSGTNMAAGILVTPPAGFEVSKTAGGASGYAATQTVGAAGTIANTIVYLRLAVGISAGSYSGNVTLTSTGATAVNVATTISEVRPKVIGVTANDRTKAFGDTLALGSNQTSFTATGLVGPDTIGSVTLTAGGGTSANDSPGVYQITPSAATGGTFNPANYDIDYVAGTLTVQPRTYADWLLTYPRLAQTGPTADPDGDAQSNLMEYYAGTHPGVGNASPVTVAFSSNALTMTYRRAKGTTGVSAAVRWTADPTNFSWSTAGVGQSAQDMGSYEKVTATLSVPPGTPRRFMRLEVTQP